MQTRLKILNVIGFILVIIVNALANYLPINDVSTGMVADQYSNLFMPAGFTFSIWGLIYLGLLAFTVFQIQITTVANNNAVKLIGLWFMVSCILNTAWLFAWHYQQIGLSVLIMLNLLVSLIIIYRNIGIGIRKVSTLEKYCVHAPFSIYLGWISVATIANISAYLTSIGWEAWGFPPEFWAAFMLFFSCITGIIILRQNLDILYVSVLIWAYLGIIQEQFSLESNIPVVITTAIACGLILLVRYIRLRKEKTTPRAYF